MSAFSFSQSQARGFIQSQAHARGHGGKTETTTERVVFCLRATNCFGPMNNIAAESPMKVQKFGRGGSIYRAMSFHADNWSAFGDTWDSSCSVNKFNFPAMNYSVFDHGGGVVLSPPPWTNNPATLWNRSAGGGGGSGGIIDLTKSGITTRFNSPFGFQKTTTLTLSDEIDPVAFVNDMQAAVTAYTTANPNQNGIVWLGFKDVPYVPGALEDSIFLDPASLNLSGYDGSSYPLAVIGSAPGNINKFGPNFIPDPHVSPPDGFPGPHSFCFFGLVIDGGTNGQGGAVICQTTKLVRQKYVLVTWVQMEDGVTHTRPDVKEFPAPSGPTFVTIPVPTKIPTDLFSTDPAVQANKSAFPIGMVTRLLEGYDAASWTAAGKPF